MSVYKNKKGFSLIELIIVIAIFGVIAAITIPALLSFVEKGREAACLEDRRTAERMYRFYKAKGGDFNPNETNGTQFLVDEKLLGSNIICKSNGVLTWGVDDSGNALIICSVHGRPLGTESFGTFNEEDIVKVAGEWKIINGKLVPTGPGENRMLIAKTNGKDYELTVNAKYNSASGGGYGVYYRATHITDKKGDKISGYCFQFDPGLGNDFVVRKVIDGAEQNPFQRVDMMTVMGADFDIHAEHQVVVDVQGDRQIIKVDGKVVLDFADNTFDKGSAGLRSWANTDVEFLGVKYKK